MADVPDVAKLPVPSSKLFLQIVDGFPIPGMMPLDCYRSALSYKPHADDIFVASYPKCGTTWTQYILLLVFRQGEPLKNNIEFMMTTPYLEFTGAKSAEHMQRPGPIKTHLPYHLAPHSDIAKYIYVTRNPKDCCVSYFHHMRSYPHHAYNGTFDEFFELFISGSIDYGDYFDHVLGWYAHRNDPNVLFMTYEEIKEKPEESILKMASFLDDKLYAEPLRSDPEKLGSVLKYSSFKQMRESFEESKQDMMSTLMENFMKMEMPESMRQEMMSAFQNADEGASAVKDMHFIRKGIIGDWRNYFTSEQSKRMDEKFAEKMKGTDMPTMWEKYL